MDIDSFSGAATVAAAFTLAFALVAACFRLIRQRIDTEPAFGPGSVPEAAQRFRDEADRLGSSLALFLNSALVFLLLFAAAHALNAERIYASYPEWQLKILVAVLIAGALFVLARFVVTSRRSRRVRLLRDANIAVAHRLRHATAAIGRVFHDVDTTAGVIDHVLVSERGVYAINVFAHRPRPEGHVAIADNALRFEPGPHTEALVPIGKRVAALEREFRRLLDHRVRVHSVIAVPGWVVDGADAGDHALVNEHHLTMLKDWLGKDSLPNDDVAALQEMLATATTA